MINIAICDDEKIFVKKLNKVVSNYLDRNQIEYNIDLFYSGEDFVELGINMSQYSILFMDIEMGSLNGIDTARILRRYYNDSYLILVTAFAKYSLEGYSVDTTRYILKTDPYFVNAIEESLSNILQRMKVDMELYTFEFKQCIKSFNLNKIAYIESLMHTLVFHVIDNGYKEYTLRAPLTYYDNMFSDKGFIRVQQSYLVNWKFIERINNYMIEIKDGTKIAASKKTYKDIKKKYVELKGEM